MLFDTPLSPMARVKPDFIISYKKLKISHDRTILPILLDCLLPQTFSLLRQEAIYLLLSRIFGSGGDGVDGGGGEEGADVGDGDVEETGARLFCGPGYVGGYVGMGCRE